MLGTSLRARHAARYAELLRLFFRYARPGLLHKRPEDGLDEAPGSALPDPRGLASELERLGPTYVKLGQLLSTRADFIPAEYVEALARLQDHVAPVPYEQVEKTVEAELGAPVKKVFARFDRE